MSNQSFVYVIGSDANSLVKIGWAKSPITRLAELQTGSPVKLEILREYPGERRMETWLHTRFAVQRKHGEWFILRNQLRKIDLAVSEYRRQAGVDLRTDHQRRQDEAWERRSAAISAGIARKRRAQSAT